MTFVLLDYNYLCDVVGFYFSQAYAAGYDANGNIIAWVNTADGTLGGTREYGAFGENIAATGVGVLDEWSGIPFGFSTKYQDRLTSHYYYGYRFYDTSSGRWLSRDPIEEEGGLNLYAFVGNNGVNSWDMLGMLAWEKPASMKDFEKALALRQGASPSITKSRTNACGSSSIDVFDTFIVGGIVYSERVSFTSACIVHDLCWSSCATNRRFDAHRSECDREFYANMRAECVLAIDPLRNALTLGKAYRDCLSMASSYYLAVRALGRATYEKAQINHCEVCIER